MNLRAAIILAVCAILSQTGCDKNPLGTVESKGNPPVVSRVRLSPATVWIDSLTPANGTYQVSAVLTSKVTDPDGSSDIRLVHADLVDPSGNHLSLIPMRDDGTSPDSAAGDGIYSARIGLSIARANVGRYSPYVIATDGSGLQSSAVAPSFLLTRRNSPPVLDSLIAPDTLRIPPGGSAILFMTMAVSDSDGLADLREVFFVSPDGANPTFHFVMKDDGGETSPPSGDAVAGDGIFSIKLILSDSPTIRGRYRFLFQASDLAGDTSSTLLHYITVK